MHPSLRGLRLAPAFLLFLAVFPAGSGSGEAATYPVFDFRQATVARAWIAQHDLAGLEATAEGMVARISSGDPYFAGPARDYPSGKLLWLNVRLKSDAGGTAQVFYYRDGSGPTEPASVRFAIRAGDWVTARVPVPALGSGYRLRIDPPGTSGRCVFERLWFEERLTFGAPAWPPPPELAPDTGGFSLVSGEAELTHSRTGWGAFVVNVGGRRVAIGQANPLIGYVVDGQPRWWSPTGAGSRFSLETEAPEVRVAVLEASDPDGARWQFRQRFESGPAPGAIGVRTAVTVDRDRAVLHLPALTLFAGVGDGGTNKQQALLAGVEYLDNEPSSSEADLEGPQARRQVTDTAKLTFPLAVVVAADRYVGLTWDMAPHVAVLFDTPDRIFRSGGHVLGLLAPGSDGLVRDEGSLVPYDTLRLAAGVALEVHARILAGTGSNAVTAVRHFVRISGLPDVPSPGYSAVEYFRLAARGWLDSAIRDGNLYRHAVVGSFTAQPAADAAVDLEWLAGRVADDALAGRLRTAAAGAIGVVPLSQRGQSGVGHVHYPVAPLIFGGVPESADAAAQSGRGHLARFVADGTIRYTQTPGGLNYGRTHWTNEANGLTAPVVVTVLEAGLVSGDRLIVDAGLRHLRALKKFHGTVPRGAQTWEVPLHTPDILGSAHLVRAYTLGYEITGEAEFLDAARYWAWTGLPFVYLRAPFPGPVGVYATTPVLGATQWVAPNWIGLPVQWCGLVYADAVERLARHDPTGPWQQVARGITASGVQQTYPPNDASYGGLLPDSYSMGAQQRNPANINPGTVFANATRLFGGGSVYDFRFFRHHAVAVHGAGDVDVLREDKDGFAFRVRGWSAKPHRVLLTGVFTVPGLKIDGVETRLSAPHRHTPDDGRLILEVTGSPRIDLGLPARTALRIDRRPEGARLSWPLMANPLQPEVFSSIVGAGAAGRTFDRQPVVAGDRWMLDIPTSGEAGFFRLYRPGG